MRLHRTLRIDIADNHVSYRIFADAKQVYISISPSQEAAPTIVVRLTRFTAQRGQD